MIPVKQSIVGDGKEGRPMGDCFRACVASIFELPLEDVPHFVGNGASWHRDVQRWLGERSLVLSHKHWDEPAPTLRLLTYGWGIATVTSELFPASTHAVVVRGMMTRGGGAPGDVAHDPSPTPRSTPYSFLGVYWLEVVDPARLAVRP